MVAALQLFASSAEIKPKACRNIFSPLGLVHFSPAQISTQPAQESIELNLHKNLPIQRPSFTMAKAFEWLSNTILKGFFGIPSIEELQKNDGMKDEAAWGEFKKRITGPMKNINLLAAIAVPAFAAFLVTAPSGDLATMVNWCDPTAYAFIWAGGYCCIITAQSGVGAVCYLNSLPYDSFKQLLKSPWKIFVLLLLLLMPVIAISAGGVFAVVASGISIFRGSRINTLLVIVQIFGAAIALIVSGLVALLYSFNLFSTPTNKDSRASKS